MADEHIVMRCLVHLTRLRAVTSLTAAAIVVCALACTSGCATSGGAGRTIPPGTSQPDQFLYGKGTEALAKKKWITAREFFKLLNESYIQSPLRPDAKLGIGDSYLGEGGDGNVVYAINEFQEFLSFYPLHTKADYAQYKLALAHFRQMRAPNRDQTETIGAIRELETFVARYPNSQYLPEVKTRLREARDRLSEADFLVGRFYYKQAKFYPAAIDRFSLLLKQDPEFIGRDKVYFYLGESLMKIQRSPDALPYYERIVAEFEKSEYLDMARKRIEAIKSQTDARKRS